jgi:hypothetical protein
MRTLASMTPDEIAAYLTMLGQATAGVTTPDATFCLVLFGPDMQAHYTSNCRRLEMPDALEELARNLRKTMAPNN